MSKVVAQFEMRGIKKGVVNLVDPDNWKMALWKLEKSWPGLKRKRYLAILAEEVENTRQEQKYYRKVLCEWVGEQDPFNCSGEQMHGTYQAQGFWTDQTESGMPFIKSTALGLWSTVEFEKRLQNIRQWLWDDFGIRAPLPNEVFFE